AGLSAAAFSAAPSAPVLRRSYQVGRYSSLGKRANKSPTSGSRAGTDFSTVSFTSSVACCHGTKTTFSYEVSGTSVATTGSTEAWSMTEPTPWIFERSKRWVSLKNGSYCRTGLPLLLKIVQPLPTQRGLTAGPPGTSGPGSAWIFFWISRPKPSEYDRLCWIFVF